jgi:hypothetical protein
MIIWASLEADRTFCIVICWGRDIKTSEIMHGACLYIPSRHWPSASTLPLWAWWVLDLFTDSGTDYVHQIIWGNQPADHVHQIIGRIQPGAHHYALNSNLKCRVRLHRTDHVWSHFKPINPIDCLCTLAWRAQIRWFTLHTACKTPLSARFFFSLCDVFDWQINFLTLMYL